MRRTSFARRKEEAWFDCSAGKSLASCSTSTMDGIVSRNGIDGKLILEMLVGGRRFVELAIDLAAAAVKSLA
jgi:hypothetical protein